MVTKPQVVASKIVSRNPADGSVVGEYGIASPAQVQAHVDEAHVAQKSWAQKPIRDRLNIIRRFQRLLHAKKDEVATLITRESGKPQVEALLTEVLVVLDAARFLIDTGYRLLRPEHIPHANLIMKAKRGRLVREPYGVIGIISPWNYPFSIPATETLAALMAGNAVVLKPSELTPAVAFKLRELLLTSGIPDGVFRILVGEGETGAALLAANIDKLVFTGSVATGKRIAKAAAEKLLPVVLELGGKDPMIVLEDADIEVATSGAVWGAFVNAGQTCLSVERVYVHRSIYERFAMACAHKTRMLRVGNGLDPQHDIGPLIHDRQLRVVEDHVNDALAVGARLLAGGERLAKLGPNFYAPTVLADVNHSMRVMREETFGPVLPIMPFDTEDEAISLANESPYGLSASVWTRNRKRGERVAAQVEAGTVMINDAVACFGISEAPHGGFKASGIGRTHGRLGLEEMTRVKYVDSDLVPRLKRVWWYGYGPEFSRQMRSFVDWLFSPRLGDRLRGMVRSANSIFRRRY